MTPEPVVFVQLVENSETVNNAAVSTPPFASIGQGSLLVVWVWYHSATEQVTALTDSAGNPYGRAVGPTQGQGLLAGQQQEIWFASSSIPGNAVVVTATFSNAFDAEKSITAHEYTGAALVNTLDSASAATGATATPSSGPAAATQRSSIKANASEDQRTTAPGPVAATFTVAAAQDWIAQVAVFR